MTMAGHAKRQLIRVLKHGLVDQWLKLTEHGATRPKLNKVKYSKVKYMDIAYSQVRRTPASPLRELTCHMGSHSITYHPAEATFPPLPQPKLVLD